MFSQFKTRRIGAMLCAAVASVNLIPAVAVQPAPVAQPAVDYSKLHINVLRNMIRDNPNIPADVKANRVKLTKVKAIEILSRVV